MTDKGKEIFFFEYFDHAFHIGDPEVALKSPYILWCVGIIDKEDKNFIMIRNAGSTSYDKDYSNDAFEMIFKSAIINKKILGVIGDI